MALPPHLLASLEPHHPTPRAPHPCRLSRPPLPHAPLLWTCHPLLSRRLHTRNGPPPPPSPPSPQIIPPRRPMLRRSRPRPNQRPRGRDGRRRRPGSLCLSLPHHPTELNHREWLRAFQSETLRAREGASRWLGHKTNGERRVAPMCGPCLNTEAIHTRLLSFSFQICARELHNGACMYANVPFPKGFLLLYSCKLFTSIAFPESYTHQFHFHKASQMHDFSSLPHELYT